MFSILKNLQKIWPLNLLNETRVSTEDSIKKCLKEAAERLVSRVLTEQEERYLHQLYQQAHGTPYTKTIEALLKFCGSLNVKI